MDDDDDWTRWGEIAADRHAARQAAARRGDLSRTARPTAATTAQDLAAADELEAAYLRGRPAAEQENAAPYCLNARRKGRDFDGVEGGASPSPPGSDDGGDGGGGGGRDGDGQAPAAPAAESAVATSGVRAVACHPSLPLQTPSSLDSGDLAWADCPVGSDLASETSGGTRGALASARLPASLPTLAFDDSPAARRHFPALGDPQPPSGLRSSPPTSAAPLSAEPPQPPVPASLVAMESVEVPVRAGGSGASPLGLTGSRAERRAAAPAPAAGPQAVTATTPRDCAAALGSGRRGGSVAATPRLGQRASGSAATPRSGSRGGSAASGRAGGVAADPEACKHWVLPATATPVAPYAESLAVRAVHSDTLAILPDLDALLLSTTAILANATRFFPGSQAAFASLDKGRVAAAADACRELAATAGTAIVDVSRTARAEARADAWAREDARLFFATTAQLLQDCKRGACFHERLSCVVFSCSATELADDRSDLTSVLTFLRARRGGAAAAFRTVVVIDSAPPPVPFAGASRAALLSWRRAIEDLADRAGAGALVGCGARDRDTPPASRPPPELLVPVAASTASARLVPEISSMLDSALAALARMGLSLAPRAASATPRGPGTRTGRADGASSPAHVAPSSPPPPDLPSAVELEAARAALTDPSTGEGALFLSALALGTLRVDVAISLLGKASRLTTSRDRLMASGARAAHAYLGAELKGARNGGWGGRSGGGGGYGDGGPAYGSGGLGTYGVGRGRYAPSSGPYGRQGGPFDADAGEARLAEALRVGALAEASAAARGDGPLPKVEALLDAVRGLLTGRGHGEAGGPPFAPPTAAPSALVVCTHLEAAEAVTEDLRRAFPELATSLLAAPDRSAACPAWARTSSAGPRGSGAGGRAARVLAGGMSLREQRNVACAFRKGTCHVLVATGDVGDGDVWPRAGIDLVVLYDASASAPPGALRAAASQRGRVIRLLERGAEEAVFRDELKGVRARDDMLRRSCTDEASETRDVIVEGTEGIPSALLAPFRLPEPGPRLLPVGAEPTKLVVAFDAAEGGRVPDAASGGGRGKTRKRTVAGGGRSAARRKPKTEAGEGPPAEARGAVAAAGATAPGAASPRRPPPPPPPIAESVLPASALFAPFPPAEAAAREAASRRRGRLGLRRQPEGPVRGGAVKAAAEATVEAAAEAATLELAAAEVAATWLDRSSPPATAATAAEARASPRASRAAAGTRPASSSSSPDPYFIEDDSPRDGSELAASVAPGQAANTRRSEDERWHAPTSGASPPAVSEPRGSSPPPASQPRSASPPPIHDPYGDSPRGGPCSPAGGSPRARAPPQATFDLVTPSATPPVDCSGPAGATEQVGPASPPDGPPSTAPPLERERAAPLLPDAPPPPEAGVAAPAERAARTPRARGTALAFAELGAASRAPASSPPSRSPAAMGNRRARALLCSQWAGSPVGEDSPASSPRGPSPSPRPLPEAPRGRLARVGDARLGNRGGGRRGAIPGVARPQGPPRPGSRGDGRPPRGRRPRSSFVDDAASASEEGSGDGSEGDSGADEYDGDFVTQGDGLGPDDRPHATYLPSQPAGETPGAGALRLLARVRARARGAVDALPNTPGADEAGSSDEYDLDDSFIDDGSLSEDGEPSVRPARTRRRALGGRQAEVEMGGEGEGGEGGDGDGGGGGGGTGGGVATRGRGVSGGMRTAGARARRALLEDLVDSDDDIEFDD